jgi:NAD(P)-dependent dehydrogenase (short-subunit alcohol dehydrogenase family)
MTSPVRIQQTSKRSTSRLQDKVTVVTGAARGIGRAAAVALGREGADIAGIDITAPVDPRSGVKPATPEDLQETAKLVRATGRRCLGLTLDQRNLLRCEMPPCKLNASSPVLLLSARTFSSGAIDAISFSL